MISGPAFAHAYDGPEGVRSAASSWASKSRQTIFGSSTSQLTRRPERLLISSAALTIMEALAGFFRRTGSDFRRFNYLGEWHSHPSFAVLPSGEDMMSMQNLVNGERDIDFSALVIVRLRCFFLLEAAAYMFVRHSTPSHVALTTR